MTTITLTPEQVDEVRRGEWPIDTSNIMVFGLTLEQIKYLAGYYERTTGLRATDLVFDTPEREHNPPAE